MNHEALRVRRLVHLAEGGFQPKEAKTSVGVLRYGVHTSVAVLDSTQAGKTCQEVVGVGGNVPVVATLREALAHKPDCLLIGVAPRGGQLPAEWRSTILEAIEAGLDVYNGLHTFLSEDAEFAAAAARRGVRLWDVRKAPRGLPVALARAREAKSYINLTVGTDCSVGKMSTSLEIQRVAKRRGIAAEFVATGQTGILIAGWGHPADAIAGDFIAGAVEKDVMSVDGRCDVILVEGQGSLLHPGYSPVTLGLLHGCLPHSLIVCHQASRREIARGYGLPISPLRRVGEIHAQATGWIRPTQVIGVSLNTYDMTEAQAREAVRAASEETGLPATDPVRFGAEPLVEAIENHMKELGRAPTVDAEISA